MLEGNELEKEYDGGAGKIIVDVDDKGKVKISNEYNKVVNSVLTVKSLTTVETDIFAILEKITEKTDTKFDDKLVAGIKALLGIKPEPTPEV